MTIRYATLLAATKLRTRIVGSIVSIIAASLVASLMLLATFITTGVEHSFASARNAKLADLHLVQDTYSSFQNPQDTKPAPVPLTTFEEYSKQLKAAGASTAYQEISYGNFVQTDPKPKSSDGQLFSGISDDIYAANLDDSQHPIASDGSVPVLISQSYVLSLAGVTFQNNESASERVIKTKRVFNDWRGRTLTWQQTPEGKSTVTIKTTIQGFLSDGLFGAGNSATVLAPLSNVRPLLTPDTEQDGSQSYLAAFPNAQLQQAYLDSVTDPNSNPQTGNTIHFASSYGDPLLQFNELVSSVGNVLKYVVLVLLIAVAIAISTTLSKLVSDSERETGVFRAVGAKISDILQIYLTYATGLSIMAMLLASIISLSIASYLTAHFGQTLGYELVNVSGSSNLGTQISFIGWNPLQILEIFGAILLAALLGAIIPLLNLLRKDPIKALRAE